METVVDIQLEYWMVARRDTLQRPEVVALVKALVEQVHEMHGALMG